MLNFIRKQCIDVIQWENPDEDTLVWRFPIADQEIQNGASLTVRESQAAVFVDEGVTLKRMRPAPQGRGYRIRKRSNHVTLHVGTKTND